MKEVSGNVQSKNHEGKYEKGSNHYNITAFLHELHCSGSHGGYAYTYSECS